MGGVTDGIICLSSLVQDAHVEENFCPFTSQTIFKVDMEHMSPHGLPTCWLALLKLKSKLG
jgi:hypothetical protein